ncbi:MAG: hypothetical protein ABI877_11580, partial [Gemmatimonadaceae bacterium]
MSEGERATWQRRFRSPNAAIGNPYAPENFTSYMKGINQFNEGTTDQARQVAKQGLERRLRRGAPDQDFQQGTTD